jgi:hypothetical protein
VNEQLAAFLRSDRHNPYHLIARIHVMKHAKPPDSKFPLRQLVRPKPLAALRFQHRLIDQLNLDLSDNPLSVLLADCLKVSDGLGRKCNPMRHWILSPFHGGENLASGIRKTPAGSK